MARNRKNDLTPEEIALIKAQTAATGAQPGQAAAELAAKQRIALDQLASEAEINRAKMGLGREEIQGRDRQAQLAAAIGLLDTGAKERIAREGEKGNIASDLAKRGDIPQSVLASTLAESGQPGLYNALEQDKAAKRDAFINSNIPGLLKDPNREKTLKPIMEAAFPGSFDVGVARAFPKAENESVRASTVAKRFEGTTAAPAGGGADYSGLIGTLLNKSGVTPTEATGEAPTASGPLTAAGIALGPARPYPVLPNTPETSYTGLGHGPLEGSKLVEGGIQTPSGGFIGGDFTKPRYAALIKPRGDITSMANANVNGPTTSDEIPSVPALPGAIQAAAPQVGQGGTTVPFDQLIAPGPAGRRSEFAGAYPLQPNTGGPLDLPNTPPSYLTPAAQQTALALQSATPAPTATPAPVGQEQTAGTFESASNPLAWLSRNFFSGPSLFFPPKRRQ